MDVVVIKVVNDNNDEGEKKTYLIVVADAADAVSVNFSGRCKFFQTERENLPFYCVHSMYNVCNLYKFVLIYEHLGVEFQLQKLYQCKKNSQSQDIHDFTSFVEVQQ